MKDQCDLIRAAHIQMIPDDSFKPHSTGLGTIEYASVGNFELPKCQLISVTGAEFSLGEGRGEASQPTREKALHGAWTETITDHLQGAASWQARNPLSSAS